MQEDPANAAAAAAADFTPSTEQAPTPQLYHRRLNSQRFTIELEFLSSLASPAYLVHLHSLGYLQSSSFIRYLAYLHQTWSQPAYIKYVRYPNAILLCKALVENPEFRSIVGRDGWEAEVTKQIIRQWAGERNATTTTTTNAMKDLADQAIEEQVNIKNTNEVGVADIQNDSANPAGTATATQVKDEDEKR